MKKIAIIIALLFGMNSFILSQTGGMLRHGPEPVQDMFGKSNDDVMPLMPTQHNQGGNHDADAPLASGVLVLLGLGAGYALVRRKKSE